MSEISDVKQAFNVLKGPVAFVISNIGLVPAAFTAWEWQSGTPPNIPSFLVYFGYGVLTGCIAWVGAQFIAANKLGKIDSEFMHYQEAPKELRHLIGVEIAAYITVGLLCITTVGMVSATLVLAIAWRYDHALMVLAAGLVLILLIFPILNAIRVWREAARQHGLALEKSIRFKLAEWPFVEEPYSDGPYSDQSNEVLGDHEARPTWKVRSDLLKDKIIDRKAPQDAILAAAFEGNVDAAEQVVHAVGPQTLTTSDVDGWSPLHFAIAAVKTDAVESLLALGASVDQRDCWQMTPLMLASYLSRHRDYAPELVACAESLIKAGAKVNAQDRVGKSALHHAAYGLFTAMVELLIGHGADVELKDEIGHTPLAELYFRGPHDLEAYKRMLGLFLDKGADPWTRTDGGRTELSSVAVYGRWKLPDFIKFFESHGIKLSSYPDDAGNPISDLARKGKWNTVARLRRHDLPEPKEMNWLERRRLRREVELIEKSRHSK